MNSKLLWAVVAVLALGVLAQQWLSSGPDRDVTVRHLDEASLRITTGGPVVGYSGSQDTYGWLGIPYAAPPTGPLRWRAPHLPEPWREPRPAIAKGSACPQFASILSPAEGVEDGDVIGAEDCLVLNIYAPRPASAERADPLPVMFWIHGGGNTMGTANTYDGAALAASHNVVVVAINYRLGVLGWLSHPAFRERAANPRDASGNFGILDMIAALEWVQYNIGEFGGDPDRVTIFGESAGGRNVYALMASPLAQDLFQRAIVQSGSVGTSTLERAENYADDETIPGHSRSSRELVDKWLVASGKQSSAADARQQQAAMPASELLQSLRGISLGQLFASLGADGMYSVPQHFRDGSVLPVDPLLQVFADTSRYNAVPLITGTNRDEAKLFLFMDPELVEQRFGLFPKARDPQRYDWLSAYLSDAWKAKAVDEVAAVIAASGESAPPVYGYRWDWDESSSSWFADLPQLLGAAHALEMDFIFGDIFAAYIPGLRTEDNAPGRDDLAKAMRSYWSAFAYNGMPGTGAHGELPPWPSWAESEGHFMLMDTESGGGLRITDEGVTANSLKQRLREDEGFVDDRDRCTLYANLFRGGGVDDFFDEQEWQNLGCAGLNAWKLLSNN